MTPTGLEQWPARLQRARSAGGVRDEFPGAGAGAGVVVLAETDSTQDAARRLGLAAGRVIVAGRQTAGRGRLGRAWADTGTEGIAVTFVVEGPSAGAGPRRERLAVASAVGVARAAESVLGRGVAIKWPNDILVDGRKLAGILIEQTDSLAYIGVGMNVSQKTWPAALADRAVSLAQLGAQVDRLEVLETLLPTVDAALRLTDNQLLDEFASRDGLRGTTATFRSDGRTVRGLVERIDPLRGLLVNTGSQVVALRAATTTLLSTPGD